MSILRTGSRGSEVKLLQAMLNRRYEPRPKLAVDGIYGPKTESAVRGFQTARGLKIDGLAGPQTFGALRKKETRDDRSTSASRRTGRSEFVGPPFPAGGVPAAATQQTTGGGTQSPKVTSANLKKFVKLVGSAPDFVDVVRNLERRFGVNDRGKIMETLFKGGKTPRGERYLVIRPAAEPKILDIIHFFTLASLTYSKQQQPTPFGTPMPIGGSPGKALLNGVANEVVQCVNEATSFKLNSCFAREDLFSNSLGVKFGEKIVASGMMPRRNPISTMLDRFLAQLNPAPPGALRQVKLPSNTDVATELFTTVLLGAYDLAVPSAY